MPRTINQPEWEKSLAQPDRPMQPQGILYRDRLPERLRPLLDAIQHARAVSGIARGGSLGERSLYRAQHFEGSRRLPMLRREGPTSAEIKEAERQGRPERADSPSWRDAREMERILATAMLAGGTIPEDGLNMPFSVVFTHTARRAHHDRSRALSEYRELVGAAGGEERLRTTAEGRDRAEQLGLVVGDADVRITLIQYEQLLIDDFFSAIENYLLYLQEHPDLVERAPLGFEGGALQKIPEQEAQILRMVRDLTRAMQDVTVLGNIRYVERALVGSQLRLLQEKGRELTWNGQRRKFVEYTPNELLQILPQIRQRDPAAQWTDEIMTMLVNIPVSWRDRTLQSLVTEYRPMSESMVDALDGRKFDDSELRLKGLAYVRSLRQWAVRRGLLENENQDVEIAAAKREKELRDIFRRHALVERREGAAGGGQGVLESRRANVMYLNLLLAHKDKIFQSIIEGGQFGQFNEFVADYRRALAELVGCNTQEALLSGNLLALLAARQHIAPSRVPLAGRHPLTDRERAEITSSPVPQELRRQLDREWGVHAGGLEGYLNDVEASLKKQEEALGFLRGKILEMLNSFALEVQRILALFAYAMNLVPRYTGVGEMNLENARNRVARMFGCRWAELNTKQLLEAYERLGKLKDQIEEAKGIVERFGSLPGVVAVRRDVRLLRELMNVDPEKLKLSIARPGTPEEHNRFLREARAKINAGSMEDALRYLRDLRGQYEKDPNNQEIQRALIALYDVLLAQLCDEHIPAADRDVRNVLAELGAKMEYHLNFFQQLDSRVVAYSAAGAATTVAEAWVAWQAFKGGLRLGGRLLMGRPILAPLPQAPAGVARWNRNFLRYNRIGRVFNSAIPFWIAYRVAERGFAAYESWQESAKKKDEIRKQLVRAGFAPKDADDPKDATVFERAGMRVNIKSIDSALDADGRSRVAEAALYGGLEVGMLIGIRMAATNVYVAVIVVAGIVLEITINYAISEWNEADVILMLHDLPPWLTYALDLPTLMSTPSRRMNEYDMLHQLSGANLGSWIAETWRNTHTDELREHGEVDFDGVRRKLLFSILKNDLAQNAPDVLMELIADLTSPQDLEKFLQGDFTLYIIPFFFKRLREILGDRAKGREDRKLLSSSTSSIDIRRALRDAVDVYLSHLRIKRYVTLRLDAERDPNRKVEFQGDSVPITEVVRFLGEQRVMGRRLMDMDFEKLKRNFPLDALRSGDLELIRSKLGAVTIPRQISVQHLAQRMGRPVEDVRAAVAALETGRVPRRVFPSTEVSFRQAVAIAQRMDPLIPVVAECDTEPLRMLRFGARAGWNPDAYLTMCASAQNAVTRMRYATLYETEHDRAEFHRVNPVRRDLLGRLIYHIERVDGHFIDSAQNFWNAERTRIIDRLRGRFPTNMHPREWIDRRLTEESAYMFGGEYYASRLSRNDALSYMLFPNASRQQRPLVLTSLGGVTLSQGSEAQQQEFRDRAQEALMRACRSLCVLPEGDATFTTANLRAVTIQEEPYESAKFHRERTGGRMTVHERYREHDRVVLVTMFFSDAAGNSYVLQRAAILYRNPVEQAGEASRLGEWNIWMGAMLPYHMAELEMNRASVPLLETVRWYQSQRHSRAAVERLSDRARHMDIPPDSPLRFSRHEGLEGILYAGHPVHPLVYLSAPHLGSGGVQEGSLEHEMCKRLSVGHMSSALPWEPTPTAAFIEFDVESGSDGRATTVTALATYVNLPSSLVRRKAVRARLTGERGWVIEDGIQEHMERLQDAHSILAKFNADPQDLLARIAADRHAHHRQEVLRVGARTESLRDDAFVRLPESGGECYGLRVPATGEEGEAIVLYRPPSGARHTTERQVTSGRLRGQKLTFSSPRDATEILVHVRESADPSAARPIDRHYVFRGIEFLFRSDLTYDDREVILAYLTTPLPTADASLQRILHLFTHQVIQGQDLVQQLVETLRGPYERAVDKRAFLRNLFESIREGDLEITSENFRQLSHEGIRVTLDPSATTGEARVVIDADHALHYAVYPGRGEVVLTVSGPNQSSQPAVFSGVSALNAREGRYSLPRLFGAQRSIPSEGDGRQSVGALSLQLGEGRIPVCFLGHMLLREGVRDAQNGTDGMVVTGARESMGFVMTPSGRRKAVFKEGVRRHGDERVPYLVQILSEDGMRVETYALFWGVDFLSRRIGRRLSAEQDAEMLRECGGDSPDAPYVMLERRRAAQAAYEIMMTPSSTEDVDRPEFGRPVERILGLFPSTSAPNTYLLYRRAMLTLYRELPDHESRRDFLHDLFDLLEQDVNGGLTAPQLAEGRGEYVVGEQQSQMLVGADPRLTAICQILQSRFVPGRHGDLFSVPSDIGNVLRREGPLPEVGQWVGIISGRREMYVAAPPPAFERRDPIIRLRRYDRRDCDTRWEEYGNVGSRAVERGSYTGGDRSPEERDTVPYVVWNAQTGRIEPLFGCRSIVQLQRSLNVQEESRRQAMLHYLSTPYDRERGQLVCMQALKDILGLCAYQEVVEQLGTGMDAIQNTKFDLYYGLKDLYWNARDQRAFLRELVEILTARKALPDGTMVRAGLISTPIKDKIIEHFQRRFPQRRGNEAVA